MRNLLLASVAVIGGLAAASSAARAEALVNIQQPGTIPGAIVPPGFGTSNPGPTPQLPGTITVRMDGRVWFYGYAGSDTGRNAVVTPVAGSATSLGSPQANTKLADYGFGNYVRLYPQFAGLTANGIKYGAFVEIRQDNASPPGGGANGSVSGAVRTRGQLYYRRQYVYVGTDTVGTLRAGNTDQPTVAFYSGNFENFNDGGWDGDLPSFFTGGTTLAGLPFLDVGNLYATSKVVYFSPKLANFDFGVSFEPSTAGVNSGPGNCPFGVTANAGLVTTGVGGNSALGCDAASSTSSGDNARRRNTVDASLRYRAAFGPVGWTVNVGGMYSGRVLDNSTPAKAVQFQNLAVFDFRHGTHLRWPDRRWPHRHRPLQRPVVAGAARHDHLDVRSGWRVLRVRPVHRRRQLHRLLEPRLADRGFGCRHRQPQRGRRRLGWHLPDDAGRLHLCVRPVRRTS